MKPQDIKDLETVLAATEIVEGNAIDVVVTANDTDRLAFLAEDIRVRMKRSALDIYQIGTNLLSASEILAHGEFLKWVDREFGMGKSSAYQFINVATAFQDKLPKFGNLKIAASALYQLAAPSAPEGARSEALSRAALGETITPTKALEMLRRHKKINVPAPTATPTESNYDSQKSDEKATITSQRTPLELIALASECLGSFTQPELEEHWDALVFINPMGINTLAWAKKLLREHKAGRVKEALALLPPNTKWFALFKDHYLCVLERQMGDICKGSVFVYLGKQPNRFVSCCTDYGSLWYRYGWRP